MSAAVSHAQSPSRTWHLNGDTESVRYAMRETMGTLWERVGGAL